MSVDSVLDQAFTTLLTKAQRRLPDTPTPPPRTATVNFEWTGGGTPIVVPSFVLTPPPGGGTSPPLVLTGTQATVDPILVEVPFSCSLQWVHLYAGDATGRPTVVTATVDIALTQITTFGTAASIVGTGVSAILAAASVSTIPLLGWVTNFTTGDILIARLTSFTGLATWLTCSLLLRATDVTVGITGVQDTTGTPVVDANGNPVVLRS